MTTDFSVLSDKKVLVTGGGGFIGSHLVRRLIAVGAQVAIISKRDQVPWRLVDVKDRVDLYAADITQRQKIIDLFTHIQPDFVFHLAAYGVDAKDQDILRAVRVNVFGTINVLLAMSACGCPRIVCMGTGSEYGKNTYPVKETALLQPVNIYGSSKAASTVLTHQYAAQLGIDIITLRPFGVFGEAEPTHKLFCHTILTLLGHRDLNTTSGSQLRDYCYVENIVDGLLISVADKRLKNEVFNIGTGESHPVRYYIEKIYAMINPRCDVRFGTVPHRKNEPWSPSPSVDKIKSQLDWHPRIGLDEGLRKTICWYRANKHLYHQ